MLQGASTGPVFFHQSVNFFLHYGENKIMKNRTRKYALVLHLSEDEKRILECKLKLSDMRSKSDFIRMLIVNGFVYTIDYQYLRKYNYQLSMIGRNINQIAHKVNTTGSVYKEDMAAIQIELKELWKTQKAMLARQPIRDEKRDIKNALERYSLNHFPS